MLVYTRTSKSLLIHCPHHRMRAPGIANLPHFNRRGGQDLPHFNRVQVLPHFNRRDSQELEAVPFYDVLELLPG